MRGERGRADDRVVAPVVAFGAVPPGHAVRDHRPVDAAGELLHAREQRVAVDDHRQGLDQRDIGMAFHRAGEAHDGFAGHQAVGVEDQHLLVGAAEAPHPVGDVAGLALEVVVAAPIEQPRRRPDARAQVAERRFLDGRHVRPVAVAEHEDIELLRLAGRCDRFAHRLQAGHEPLRFFVVDRHQQCGPRRQCRQRTLRRQPEARTARRHHQHEAGERADEGLHDPREQRHEQHQQQHFQHVDADAVQHPPDLVGRDQRQQGRGAEHAAAAPGHPARRGRQLAWRRLGIVQRLRGHRQRRFRRQQRCRSGGVRRHLAGRHAHGVHRYSQVSDNGAPASFNRARSSMASSAVANSKLMRQPPVSALR